VAEKRRRPDDSALANDAILALAHAALGARAEAEQAIARVQTALESASAGEHAEAEPLLRAAERALAGAR
jgi:hypothetical protein